MNTKYLKLLVFALGAAAAAGCGRSVLSPSADDTPELRQPRPARSLLGGDDPAVATCGNTALDPGEDCDGDLGLSDCASVGLGGGSLTCHPTACRLDASGCSGVADPDCRGGAGCDMPPPPDCAGMAGCDIPTVCGDGVVDRGEECDRGDLRGQDCRSLGYAHGTLGCTAGCQLDPGGCGFCGDGRRSGPEACDGADLAGLACASVGLPDGTLRCSPDCGLDVSQCGGPDRRCGDGVVTLPEQCDGRDLGGRDCRSMGYEAGELRCSPVCSLDTSQCYDLPPFCGDGILDFPERCDSGNLGGASCASIGLGQGQLRCAPDCQLDTSGCFPVRACGNGVVDFPEECDGDNLAGASCATLGLGGGSLRCNACRYDTSGCVGIEAWCGNGVREGLEQCDGGDLAGESCGSLVGLGGQLQCDPGCGFDIRGCQDPNPQQCADCALQRCPDETNQCLQVPGCIQGLMCVLQQCGGAGDLMCVLQCFGGDFNLALVASRTYQCLQAQCPGVCNL